MRCNTKQANMKNKKQGFGETKRSSIVEKFHNKFTNFLNDGGGILFFSIASIGLGIIPIGHYIIGGFNWIWFLVFELPLYLFWAYAVYIEIHEYRKDFVDNKNYDDDYVLYECPKRNVQGNNGECSCSEKNDGEDCGHDASDTARRRITIQPVTKNRMKTDKLKREHSTWSC